MARDIKFLQQDLKKLVESIVSREMLETIGARVVEIIQKRTRSGKGLDKDAQGVGGAGLTNLKPLSEMYREARKKMILGPFASANRSNLTMSGELLESIIYKIVGRDVVIEVENSDRGDGLTNKQLAKYVTDQGRPFFGLSTTEGKILDNFIRRLIRERLRDLNRK